MAPKNLALPKPEVRATILLPPYGRIKSCGAVGVLRQSPAGALIRQKIHMQGTPATARA
jgi:hypothetical protein